MNSIQSIVNNTNILLRSIHKTYYSRIKPTSITQNQTQPADIRDILFSQDYKAIIQQSISIKQHKSWSTYEKVWQCGDNIEQNSQLTLQILQTNNLYLITCYLQVICDVTNWGQKHVISAQSYIAILHKYYCLFGIGLKSTERQRSGKNNKISSNVDLKYLIPKFIYLQNQQILDLLKVNQKLLLEKLLSSRDITHIQFAAVVSTQIYNVTDLPLLHQLLYKHYIPKLANIDSLSQYSRCLEYLYKFQCIEDFLLQRILHLFQRHQTVKQIQLSTLIDMLELLSVYFFKNSEWQHRSTKARHLQLIVKDVLSKQVKINGQLMKVQEMLEHQHMWTQVVYGYSKPDQSIVQQIINMKEQFAKMCELEHKTFNFLHGVFKGKEGQLLGLNEKQVQLSLFTISLIKVQKLLIKTISIASYFKFINLTTYVNILSSPINLQFLRENAFCDDFLKDVVKVHERIALDHSQWVRSIGDELKYKFDKVDTQYNNFRTSMTNFIQKDLANVSNQLKQDYKLHQYSSYFRCFYPPLQIDQLKATSIANLMMHCLHVKHNPQQTTQQKMILLLKKDCLFLWTTMNYDGRQLLANYLRNNLMFSNYCLNKWNYPYFYSYISEGKHYGIVNHLNRNQMMPSHLMKYKTRTIKNYVQLCKAIKLNKS